MFSNWTNAHYLGNYARTLGFSNEWLTNFYEDVTCVKMRDTARVSTNHIFMNVNVTFSKKAK